MTISAGPPRPLPPPSRPGGRIPITSRPRRAAGLALLPGLAAVKAVAAASKKVNAICPGAAS